MQCLTLAWHTGGLLRERSFSFGSTVLLYSVLRGFQLEYTLLVFREELSDFQDEQTMSFFQENVLPELKAVKRAAPQEVGPFSICIQSTPADSRFNRDRETGDEAT